MHYDSRDGLNAAFQAEIPTATQVPNSLSNDRRGDFTATTRLLWLALIALPLGGMCAVVALLLQHLIAFFTNIFYYQKFTIPDELISPGHTALGAWAVLVPVIGGLIVGWMARYGSERIRGHGIPEALEAILIGQSRMQPRVAVLKPLSSAIAIGSGGPFGAEGPIIMTGGACGSLVAQAFNLTAAERKTLLVAGAAGGMSATFGTPIAAVLLAVELLLFEWKPRSFVPVALASAAAALVRPHLALGHAPLFVVKLHEQTPGIEALLACALVGLLAGVLSLILTRSIYLAEDAFHHLPIHWMWWPALGGLAVGIGGLLEPRALGVGYGIIEQLLQGNYQAADMAGLLVVKCLIWAIALGSGTSGGVLAPLLIMGGILGALESTFLPGGDKQMWPLVSMAAVMGGTMRAPLTGVLFAMELTYDVRMLLPLLVAAAISHCFTVLVMKRSILTEKVARRGYHVSSEYGVDPMERLSVGEVMSTEVVSIPAEMPLVELIRDYFLGAKGHRHEGYPVVDASGMVLGVITKSDLLEDWLTTWAQVAKSTAIDPQPIICYDLLGRAPIVAFPWESCRAAAERMGQRHVGRLPVVSDDASHRLLGIITRSDLLKSHALQADEESLRERFLSVQIPGFGSKKKPAPSNETG